MQKYDWLRLFSEVRPTFLPYARFTVRTRLTPEECRERLAAVTQPQKMPSLFSVRTSDDPRLIFKGQVSQTGFLAVPLDHTGSRRFQGPQPFWIKGQLRAESGGSNVTVQVYADPLGFVTGCIMVSTLITVMVWGTPSSSLDTFEKVREVAILVPLSLLYVPLSLLIFASVLLATSLKAFRVKKMLNKLLA